jgi:hypothetical protein
VRHVRRHHGVLVEPTTVEGGALAPLTYEEQTMYVAAGNELKHFDD